MKPTLVTLSFLLFVFTTYLPLTISEQVKDTNGRPIFPGGKFYIMPSIFGAAGGGVRLGTTKNSTCPVTVLQDYSEVVLGMPVQFKIPGISPGIIFTNTTQLNIVFVEKPPQCVTTKSSKWVVISGEKPRGPVSIGIGGVEDHKGRNILGGLFNIQKHGFGYKLVFCPTFSAPPGLCNDIGRYDDENGRRLILTGGDPYEVVFVDADDYSSSM